MKLPRRALLRSTAAAVSSPLLPRLARALDYPSRSVRIIVGFAPGSGLDIYARLIAQWLSSRLGQPFVVENRPGASINLATKFVAKAPPDGYTLLMASAAAFTNATLYENLSFNFIRDIAPVASVTRGSFVMVVNASFPAKTIPELVAYAKTHPGSVTMGSSGVGTLTHVAGELFNLMAGVNLVHVPYRGEAQAIVDIFGGRLDVDFSTLAGASEFIRAGKLRALAVTTPQRSEAFPDVPTIAETLPGYDASAWSGICAPRATPADIVDALNKAINAGLTDPKLKAQFAAIGSTVAPLTPAEYGKVIATETEQWAKVIRAAGIKLNRCAPMTPVSTMNYLGRRRRFTPFCNSRRLA
jgi:tripartite-type tricarboxylate transporter receptor subunit TctC